jgi:hypothetical protein
MVNSEQTPCPLGQHTVFTGWINGLHHWDRAGNLLGSRDTPQWLILDDIKYPRRDINLLPTAYFSFPVCASDGTRFTRLEMISGLSGKGLGKGPPRKYASAILNVNFTLPENFTSNDHGVLQPLPYWAVYIDERTHVSIHPFFG